MIGFVPLLFLFAGPTLPAWTAIAIMNLLGLASALIIFAAFVLAIVGLVIAVRQPTRKRESIFALAFSSIAIVLMLVRLVAFYATISPL